MARIDDLPSSARSQITKFHVFVVCLSLILTISAWLFSKNQIENKIYLRFEASRDQAIGLITERMQKYEDALWSGVAAIGSHGGDISYEDWRVFSHTLRIDEKYPGINGIGVIHFHTTDTIEAYLAEQRQVRAEFRVFPIHDQPVRMPITYIEPEDINAAAVGLDVAHELNRRTAALASRDTGDARITGPIILVQDADSTPGFLFYAPFYGDGAHESVSDRQVQFRGAVYAPFVVHKLMEGLLAKDLRSIRFSIRDGDEMIYDEHTEKDPLLDPDPMFIETISLELYGRTWVIDLRSNLAFRDENTFAQSTMILVAGLLVEALIIALLFLMVRANEQAVAFANKMTLALRKKSATLAATNTELSIKNEELEQFVYITSHDLKTPIRGIGGLTEMIEEDLEDYFDSDAANPDVSINLTRIHQRVTRMEDLTRGIMDLSQIKAHNSKSEVIEIEEVIASLISDFGLQASQLRYFGDVNSVQTDVFNFRRVLENLIGNAIKYHDAISDLEITVSAEVVGEVFRFSVQDNGPGIEPRYHRKIFDVFQTLRMNDAPESTGMGLAIVKKAVERHGGKVDIVSALGEGALFIFEWPGASDTVFFENSGKAA